MGTWIAAALLISAAPLEVDVRMVDQTARHGALERLEGNTLTLRESSKAVRLPLANVAQIAFKGKLDARSEATTWIESVGGTLMPATSFTMRDGKAHWALLDGSTMSAPAKTVRAVRFYRPADTTDAAWRRFVEQKRPTDVIVIRKSAESLDMLEGMITGVSKDTVEFEFDGQKIPVKRSKLEGIVLSSSEPALEKLLCVATDRFGGTWQVHELTATPQEAVIKTRSGMEWRGAPALLERLDFSSLGSVSLADLAPVQQSWNYFFPLPAGRTELVELLKTRYVVRKGTCPAGAGRGRSVPSLVLYSGSEVTYRLPESFESLRAGAVISPEAGRSGHVQLILIGDGKVLLSQAVRAGEAPKTIDVPLKGVRRLTIRVEFGHNLHLGDELHLCRAVLIKPAADGGRTKRDAGTDKNTKTLESKRS